MLAAATLAAATLGVACMLGGVLDPVEHALLDARYRAAPATTPASVAVVAIDDRSFNELPARERRWPWRRTLHGQVIDQLTRAGAAVIVYDVQFTEPSADPDEDLALYDAVARSRRVVLATTEVGPGGSTNVLGGDENLRNAHARAGAAHMPSGAGDIIRTIPYEVAGLPSIAVAAYTQLTGRAPSRDGFTDGHAYIDYAGPPGTVPTFSFVDVWRGRVPAAALRGKVVVVGASSPSLQDIHSTPVSTSVLMSGPEVQANAVQTVVRGVPMRDASPWLAWAALAVMAIAPGVLAIRSRLTTVVAWTTALALTYSAAAVAAFTVTGRVVPMAVPLLTLTVAMALTTLARYLGESRERHFYARYSALLEATVAERTAELEEAQREVVLRLGQAVESRETETARHIERVGALCEALALETGATPAEAALIRQAAALHDVGKIGIPDAVLLKPGRLDAAEWEIMRTHAHIGGDLLAGSRSPLLIYAEQIARTHHEWWDGGGYPDGLSGEQIPYAGRICAICDVFDALVTPRPYKQAWTIDAALSELSEKAGTQFDPDLVAPFVRCAPTLYTTLGYRDEATSQESAAA